MMRTWMAMAQLMLESQQVMGLRMMKFATGGVDAEREATRMVSEKFAIAASSAGKIALGAPLATIVADYRKVVRANGRRLGRKPKR